MRTAETGIVAAVLTLGAGAAFAQTAPLCVQLEQTCSGVEVSGAQSAATQSQAISSAIDAAVGARFNGDHRVATQEGGGKAATNTAYWVSAAGRSYAGDSAGSQNEAVFGVDVYLNGNSLAGGFLGAGKSSRESPDLTGTTDIVARVGGLYYAHQFPDTTILHFYLGGGTADYTADGASVDAKRYMGGIDVSKTIDRGGSSAFVPFAKVLIAADDVPEYSGTLSYHPAATVVGTTVTAGGRWEYKKPLGNTQLLPYVSLGLDYLRVDPDGTADIMTTWGPRLETGFSGPVGSGLLSLDLHAAKADAKTSDVGGAVTYSFGF